MKRIIALLLCAALWCAAIPGALADGADTLPAKMLEQINHASGVKLEPLRLTVTGDGPLAEQLRPFADINYGFWLLLTPEAYDAHLFALPEGEVPVKRQLGETEIAATRVYGNAEAAHVRSEALEQPLVLPVDGDALQALLNISEEQNAAWYGIALKILQLDPADWKDKWLPVLAPYESEIELWLNRFGDAPILTPDAMTGRSLMALTYTVPVEELKAETKLLLHKALQDSALTALIAKQMTPAQQEIYWNPNLAYYYDSAIDGLYMDGDVVLEREMSALGEEVSMAVQFPIPENAGMWTSLRIEREGEVTRAALVGEERRVDFSVKSTGRDAHIRLTGELLVTRQEGGEDSGFGAEYDFSADSSTRQDDEGYGHEVTAWALALSPSAALEDNSLTAPAELNGTIDFYSKYGNTSATHLAFATDALLPGAQLTLTGHLRTTSPWEIAPADGAEEIRWTDLTAAEQGDLLAGWLQRVLSLLSRVRPQELPAPELATPTDIGG